ncbi:Hypothetical predicted protein [Xyrichtys novacula]|uniref:Uncharacterized protein n=1 Tax=Xyrichtys novacula TaxID=13765 RepID=A0AAV1GRN0_XYRNO|nr:Hypothetical predicted protein [Xyrichtys novacula]
MCARRREAETERELSATLANHLIGCHTELTFEGYGSISPEMKKRDESERGRERRQGERDRICSERAAESAAVINASVYPSAPHGLISSMISTHPSPPPPRAIPHPLCLSPGERREGKDRDERRKKKYSRGRAGED